MSIESRIAALTETIQRRQMEQAEPIDELSKSLFEFDAWLAGLDEQGKMEWLEELNRPGDDGTSGLNLTREQLDHFIEEWMVT